MVEIKMSDIIKGLAIGGILLLLVTRKSDIQPNNGLQQSGQIEQREQIQIGIYGWKPLDHIQNFDDFNLKITQTTVQPVAESIEQSVEQQDSQISEQTSNVATEYGNKETWKILRNVDGDIETIEVERSARVDVRK
jgi:hypothetical protein